MPRPDREVSNELRKVHRKQAEAERTAKREYEHGVQTVNTKIAQLIESLYQYPQYRRSGVKGRFVQINTEVPQEWDDLSPVAADFLGKTEKRTPHEELVIWAYKSDDGYSIEFKIGDAAEIPVRQTFDRWLTVTTVSKFGRSKHVDVQPVYSSILGGDAVSILDAYTRIDALHAEDNQSKMEMLNMANGLVDFGKRETMKAIRSRGH